MVAQGVLGFQYEADSSSTGLTHNSRTERRPGWRVVDLAVLAVSARQASGLIVSLVCLSARMASPVVT